MTVRYHQRGGRLTPDYVCEKECIEHAQDVCQRIPGGGLDEAIGALLVQKVTPLSLEVALEVQDELQGRLVEADRLRQQQLQRAQYEAEKARLRYMRVDPNNRLVADTLEAQWNAKLRELTQVQEECERQRRLQSDQLNQEQRAQILALASEFPRLWNDPATPFRDHKRMARLLLEDVTLSREKQEIVAHIRFRGGATHSIRVPFPKAAWALRKTDDEIVNEIDQLLTDHSDSEIAAILNSKNWHSSTGSPFSCHIVGRLRRNRKLKSRLQRLREKGWLTVHEIGALLECSWTRINYWRCAGLLVSLRFGEKSDCLYQPPSETVIAEILKRQRRHCWKTDTISDTLSSAV